MNIKSKVSKDTINNVKLDRDSALNPPDADPGMDDFDWDDWGGGSSDSFGSSNDPFAIGGNDPFSSGDTFGGGNDPFSGGGDPFGNGADPWATPPVGGGAFGMQNNGQEFEDKVFEGIAKASKGTFNILKEFVESLSEADDIVAINTARMSTFMGGGFAVGGLLLALFKNPNGIPMLVGGLITSGVSIPVFSAKYEKIMNNGGFPEPVVDEPFNGALDNKGGLVGSDSLGGFDSDFSTDAFGDSGVEDDAYGDFDDDEFDLDDSDDSDDTFDLSGFDDDFDIEEDMFAEDVNTGVSVEDAMEGILNNINENNSKGIMTRQYLFDNISNCLMNINPKYDSVLQITEGSDDFEAWDAIIQSSAGILKTTKDDDMPYLISAKDKLFYVLLEIHRPKWLKNVDTLVKEIVNVCSYDEETGSKNNSIYGMGEMVGFKIFIKIMKGETAMVSLKDTFKNVSDEIKNTKNYLPVVLGVDAEGSVVWKDLKTMDSMLVTGMPRSGKSWFVQAMITQMCMWLKPSELNFYILDPKDTISDFRNFQLPHIRKFVTTDNDILKELRHIVRVEGPRRKKIIGGANCVNIWDFKKANPDVDMPLLYVLIDEVITLAERMDKETKDEFNSLLLELVSQLPALGIRIIMIPHVVKDQVLKKSITDLIPCRISVRGDSMHIEKSVGIKGFKHKLEHQGDMAVRFNNDEPMFVHSVVLTDSNEKNNELFDFLTRLWLKLEPESYSGSVKEQIEVGFKRSARESNVTISSPKPVEKPISSNLKKIDDSAINDLLKDVHSSNNDDDWFLNDEDDFY